MLRLRTRGLIVIFAIWSQCVERMFTDENKKLALIIDRRSGSVFDVPYKMMSRRSPCGSWANACPSQTEADEAFVTNNALTKDPLFVKKICHEGSTVEAAEFQRFICFAPFKIAALFNIANVTFDFGYEVYFPEKMNNLFPKLKDRNNYITLENLFGYIRENLRLPERSAIKGFFRSIFGKNNSSSFEYDQNLKMMFTWISVFEVNFDFEQWTPKLIYYQVRNNNSWPVYLSCMEYNLAAEAYQSIQINSTYSQTDQRLAFARHIVPAEPSDAACDIVCVKQWQLIPIDQFHFGSFPETVCPHMATVPIWQSTLELVMFKVDKFIYALFQALGPELHVISGISGRLQLAEKRIGLHGEELSGPKSDIYLNWIRKTIPVPDIIYKVINYKPDHCPKKKPCWYSATIVIHNDPFFEPENKICQDVTTEWGWTDVTKVHLPGSMEQHYESKYIYVCKSRPKLLRRLMDDSAKNQPHKMEDLDLYKIPSQGAKQGYHDVPVAGEVLEKLLELAKKERTLMQLNKPKKNKTPRPLSLTKINEEGEDETARGNDEDVIVEDGEEIQPAEKDYDEARSEDEPESSSTNSKRM